MINDKYEEREVKRAIALKYLWKWIGLPYVWGGDDPLAGFDCSGLIVEVLQAVGLMPHRSDDVAGGIFNRFRGCQVGHGYAGCLVVWWASGTDMDDPARAIHIEMMVDEMHTVGASGGGSKTKTKEDAIAQNAYVKLRPIGYRWTFYKIVDPFKAIQ